MSNRFVWRGFVGVLICTVCLAFAGCANGDTLAGTYHTEGGGFVLDFTGSKVTFTALGRSETYDYKIDGDKVTILDFDEGKNLELTRNSDGTLNSNIGTFTKRK